MSHVGRFPILPAHDTPFERGQVVVLKTDRGVELGEVLIAVDGCPPREGGDAPHVVRLASPDDLVQSKRAEESRPSRFSLCQKILKDGNWPWELIDVEPLLDGRATVIHYLGPHHLDVATLRARFRVECDIDVVLEPVGSDLEIESSGDHEHEDDDEDGGGCGSCGCGDGGGCGSTAAAVTAAPSASHDHGQAGPVASGCAPKAHSGCSSCGISRLLADRNRPPA
jgi:hypothetical protein